MPKRNSRNEKMHHVGFDMTESDYEILNELRRTMGDAPNSVLFRWLLREWSRKQEEEIGYPPYDPRNDSRDLYNVRR